MLYLCSRKGLRQMTHPNLYIIAGPNGAGKTTASYTLLPEMLGCTNFVNADEIARGLSPFSESINSETMNERELKARVSEGLNLAYRRLVEQKRRDNEPLIFSENGVVQFVDPNTVEI